MKQPARDEVTLDDAIAAVRDEAVDDAGVAAASARVWTTLRRDPGVRPDSPIGIRGCADVRALLSDYRQGTLQGPRALLVEDHLRECVSCRAFNREPGASHLAVLPWRPASPAVPRPQPRRYRRYLLAASVLLALGLSALAARRSFFAVPPGTRAIVQSLSGTLQRVADDGTRALVPGEEVGEGESVRTARGSQAVLRLRDGSVVEMAERAEVSVTARGLDTTVHLARGNIIVQAQKRNRGHLLVASRDCTVYVTGTVFSVSTGLKGSRVSVIEGNVRVVQGKTEKRLEAGDQLATSPSMGEVALPQEIAWSDNLDGHLALLARLTTLRKDLAAAIRQPGLRYESRLLPLVPDQAVVYATIPNDGGTFGEAYTLFEERLGQSPVLKRWWAEADPQHHGGPSLAEALEKVRSFADYLGDEVVFTMIDGKSGAHPLLLAEVRRSGLKEFLLGEIERLETPGHLEPAVRVLDEASTLLAPGKAILFVLVRPDFVAVTEDAATLERFARGLQGGGPRLEQTPFGRRIVEAYEEGVGFLFGVDLERIARATASRPPPDEELFPALPGVENVRHLIVERKPFNGRMRSGAVLDFDGPRRGMASWLGPPAPMGSLEFVSARAAVVASFVIKSPALLLDDVLAAGGDAGGRRELAELEARLNLRLREDVAETLGGEFTVALDGPLLPTPALKVIGEIDDPARLQSAVQSLVHARNEEASRAGRPLLRLEGEQAGSRTYYELRSADPSSPFEVHYAFVDGYVVAAGSRALVMQAIQIRQGGTGLPHSAGFRSLFDADNHANVSALLYQNLGRVMNVMLRGKGVASLSQRQRDSVLALTKGTPPSLVCAYGEEDHIQVAGLGGFFELDPAYAALPVLLGQLLPGTPASGVP